MIGGNHKQQFRFKITMTEPGKENLKDRPEWSFIGPYPSEASARHMAGLTFPNEVVVRVVRVGGHNELED